MQHLLLILAFISHNALAATYRSALSEQSEYFCDKTPKTLRDRVIIDAQVELAFVKTDRDLKVVAAEFADENHHRGFASGSCRDGRSWIVSTPAPAEVLLKDKGSFILQPASLNLCRRYEIDAILDGLPNPVELKPNDYIIPTQGLALLSVTCFPKDKVDAGPELWALVTLKSESISSLKSMTEFIAWLNDARRKLGLSELKSQPPALMNLAKEAGRSKTLEHPHTLLRAGKSDLKNQNIEVLGENRAIASNITGLATLFWNSPQHRRLLLNAKANAIGYSLLETKEEKQLVLILAKI